MGIDDLLDESLESLEKNFYKEKFKFSYSSLKKLMWSPGAFYQTYVLGLREEKPESHLVTGKVIHALLLEESKFDEGFIISPSDLPTGNTKTVIDSLYRHYTELKSSGDQRSELSEFEDAAIDILKDMNLHQSLKTDQQRLDKIITQETNNYWTYLKNRNGKTLIDFETYSFCKVAVETIKTNKEVCKLIGCNVTEFDNIEIHNEIMLDCDINDKSFGLKGIIDNLTIDHDKKIININDVKTTSKDLKDFPETVEFYNYWLQAAVYAVLVSIKYAHLFEQGYDLKNNFIVIDKSYQVYVFAVSQPTMEAWFERMNEVLIKAEWHYKNNSYNLPYDFALGKIIL